jgi:hypothetical protein
MIVPDAEHETPSVAARHLGIGAPALWRMIDECGARNPARPLVVHMRQAEALYRQQLRCVFPDGYARPRYISNGGIRKRLRNAGIATEHGRATRIPIGVFDEVCACASGPWSAAWRRAFAAPGRPCAPWILALALHDLAAVRAAPGDAAGDAAREQAAWCREALPAVVLDFARVALGASALAPPTRCGAAFLRSGSRAA